MTRRSYLSIGEVLSLLQEDHPDVTVSKLRFLEQQGLISPERTPSGYRKFFDADLELLRWILRQQQEHYLPLKVIKEMIERGDAHHTDAPALPDNGRPAPPDAPGSDGSAGPPGQQRTASHHRAPGRLNPADLVEAPSRRPSSEVEPAGPSPALGEQPGPVAGALPPPPLATSGGTGGGSFDLQALARRSGLSTDQIASLQDYGLIHPVPGSDASPRFDDRSLQIARYAAAFLDAGVEPRHLRMYKNAADREAGLLSQVGLPLAQRAGGGDDARELMADLLDLGRELHAVFLEAAMPDELRLDRQS